MLDGKGPIKTHGGPIHDATATLTTWGQEAQTEYFAFRIHKCGTMHLRFKRLDLLARLNEIAGGKNLRPATAA